ncbi:hypothetical protein HHK36_008417 [Tetracentron sinense]|uniref:Receptor-like serine/threonine-protein kinase n=1 Tax=Tetracentron sinense TaxID=13715 RepID=A0A834ZGB7_TETSI|nr:hypothetical protein HHK36_008417 [Tetracentron sinense]
MILTANGISILYQNRTLAWSTPPLISPVSGMQLLENGNLVLFDKFSNMVWQSFDYPTNTLLIGQVLPVGSTLLSFDSSSNGDYQLLVTDKDAILLWKEQKYWSLFTNSSVSSYMGFNSSGLFLLDYDHSPKPKPDFQLAVLDSSGHFSVLSFSSDGSWGKESIVEPPSDNSLSSCKLIEGYKWPSCLTYEGDSSAVCISNLVSVRLDSTNFVSWKFQIFAILRAHSLIGYVDGSTIYPNEFILDEEGANTAVVDHSFQNWVTQDQAIMTMINATLSSSAITHIIGYQTSREVWLALERRFSSLSRSNILQLKTNLQTMMKGSDTVDVYIQKIKEARDNLATAAVQTDDEDILICTLNGLPHEYNAFHTSIRTRSQPLSLEDLHVLLKAEEQSIEVTNKFSQNQHMPTAMTAAHFNHFGQRGGKNFGYRGRSSYRGQRGGRFHQFGSNSNHGSFRSGNFHTGSFSSNRDNSSTSGSSSFGSNSQGGPTRITCQICDKSGHLAIDCYNRMNHAFQGRHPPAQLAAMTASFGASSEKFTPNHNVWLTDSCATNHITSDVDNLYFPNAYAGNDRVAIGNGNDKASGRILYQGKSENGLYPLQASTPSAPSVPSAPSDNSSTQPQPTELEEATSNFTIQIGSGGFGVVYKGTLPSDNTRVAVKRIKNMGIQGKKEFSAEVTVIGSIRHVNLVRLHGHCAIGPERFLVYEFMSRGSLDHLLFGSEMLLEWSERVEIALGAAHGLAYLHGGCSDKILYLDVKPENILLDDCLQVKIADFGLSRLVSPEQSILFTTMRGTRGYLAPEWLTNSGISDRCVQLRHELGGGDDGDRNPSAITTSTSPTEDVMPFLSYISSDQISGPRKNCRTIHPSE